jgi:hypothetical protein
MGAKDAPVPFRVPQDAEELGRRVAEKQAALVVLDPLVEFVDGKHDSHKEQHVRQAIAGLNQVAREHGCAVLSVFHLNKGASTDPLLRISGSGAFTQIVRSQLMLGPDPEDPDGEDGSQRVLALVKKNLAPTGVKSLVYRIEGQMVGGDTGEPIGTPRMVFMGESETSGRDLLQGFDDNDRSERDDACDFLEAELTGGPRPTKEIKAAARDAGISESTLKRAKGQLGVVAERIGTEGRGGGFWQWSLRRPPTVGPLHSNEGDPLNDSAPAAGLQVAPHLNGPLNDGETLNAHGAACADPGACIIKTEPTSRGWRCKMCKRYIPRDCGGQERERQA